MLTTQWQQYLETQTPDNNSTDLNMPLAQSILVSITPSGVLSLSGDDAMRFLQGQTTCDVRDINASTSTLGAFCTPKGRVFANFRALQIGGAFYLRMNESIVESARLTLDKYIRFFKATMTNESNKWIGFGVAGQTVEIILKKQFANTPETINTVAEIKSGVIVRLPHHEPRFEIWLNDLTTAIDCWNTLSSALKISPSSVWDTLNIRAGLAMITPETIEAFTPHMINYQAVGGISFTKGCYTGQEIVARTHYLGKLKKHLYRLSIASDQLPALGGSVTQNDQNVGEVVNAVMVNSNTIELLAVIQQQAIDEGQLFINESPAEVLTLPYTLDND
jgi:hypothetical protein